MKISIQHIAVLFFIALFLPFYIAEADEPAGRYSQFKKMGWISQKNIHGAMLRENTIVLAQEVESAPAIQETKVDVEGFVFVKGGCFDMGDTFDDGSYNEKPVHKVCVNDFYMAKYEVTQALWTEVMGSNKSYFKGCEDCPADRVNWIDVQEFILRFNEKTGSSYRLPTEAEWEYAARSGGKKEKWAGISSEQELGDYAWYNVNSEKKTHSVGQKKPNGLGLYDMSGNVAEWVQDIYEAGYYKRGYNDNPKGPLLAQGLGDGRVIRGGSWYHGPEAVRTSVRDGYVPHVQTEDVGFRLAVSPQ